MSTSDASIKVGQRVDDAEAESLPRHEDMFAPDYVIEIDMGDDSPIIRARLYNAADRPQMLDVAINAALRTVEQLTGCEKVEWVACSEA